MKTKTKIMAFVSLASLTMVLLMVGVWALKTVNFTVGGNLSYIAPGIEATISKGVMSNGVWVNANDASTKMPLTQITRTDTAETLTTKFSYWQNLNMTFNEAGDDVTITFSITNDMAEKYLSINVTTSYASADNATILINTSSVELEPDASQSFTITMKVTDKTANATLSSFAIVFSMEMVEPPKPVDPDEVSYLTFEYNDTALTAKLTAISTTAPEVVKIPAMISKGDKIYTVTSIGEGQYDDDDDEYKGLSYNTSVKDIIIPNTVIDIGTGAFGWCQLNKVVVGNSVQTAYRAFDYGNIENLIFVEGLKKIPDNLVGWNHFTCPNITIPNSVTEIGDYAFYTNPQLTSIVIPDKCEIVGVAAFSWTNLVKVELPNSVKTIEEHAFHHISTLTDVSIGNGVTSIGENAFSMCGKLAEVSITATTPPSLDSEAFQSCSALTSIKVPKTSLEAYKTATNWSAYADIMVGV